VKKIPHPILESRKVLEKTLHRRKFLKSFAGWGGAGMMGYSAAASALHMMVHGAFSKIYANSISSEPRNLFELYLQGGFPAQFLYLPLRPNAGDLYVHNTNNSNNWVSGAPVYTTAPVTAAGVTLHLPFIWAQTIPRAASRGGGFVPMSNLLTNTMMARGFWNPFDSHEIGSIQISRPSVTAPSIAGMLIDQIDGSRSPIPAVAGEHDLAGATFYSRTKARKVARYRRSDNFLNPIATIMDPFRANAGMLGLLDKKDQFSALFNDALSAVAQDARRLDPGSESILSSLSGAEALFRRNFGNLTDVYNSLYAKYMGLMNACSVQAYLSSAISPIASSPYRSGETLGVIATTDLRTIVQPNSHIGYMASAFALGEFLITNNLSKAVTVYAEGTNGLQFTAVRDGVTTIHQGIPNDQHGYGVAATIPSNNFYARCVAACTYEMSLALKDVNLFDSTVMKVGSDFPRSPSNDGSGSDHAWSANGFMLTSGAIKKPSVIGNIARSPYAAPSNPALRSYIGTWGEGSTHNHEGSNGTYLNLGHYASSICTALNIPSPTPNFLSIIQDSPTEGLVPLLGPGQTRNT